MLTYLGTGQRPWTVRCQRESDHLFTIGSFFDAGNKTAMSAIPFRFFLDSGAYSAWSRGIEIDLDEYREFIRANADQLDIYASLDVIPGKPGRAATQAERNEAAERSWANYLNMTADGLSPLPVYHYGEDPRFLERMLAHGCPYIGIGGLVGVNSTNRREWLDVVFDRITDENGWPIVKTHGFGMTSIPLMFRYPWYSVDSTSWIKATAAGGIYLPQRRDGQFVFDDSPTTIFISDKSPTAERADGKHAKNMTPSMRALLDEWLVICGKTYEQVATDYFHRASCNVLFFKMVSELVAGRPFDKKKPRMRGLL